MTENLSIYSNWLNLPSNTARINTIYIYSERYESSTLFSTPKKIRPSCTGWREPSQLARTIILLPNPAKKIEAMYKSVSVILPGKKKRQESHDNVPKQMASAINLRYCVGNLSLYYVVQIFQSCYGTLITFRCQCLDLQNTSSNSCTQPCTHQASSGYYCSWSHP